MTDEPIRVLEVRELRLDDVATRYAWFGTREAPQSMVRIPLADFERLGRPELLDATLRVRAERGGS